jgi:hypothetical protein
MIPTDGVIDQIGESRRIPFGHMTWLDAASLCIFLCNIAFMVGAGLLLLKILGSVQHSQNVLAEKRPSVAACPQRTTCCAPI